MTKDEALRLALDALKKDRAWLETDAPTEVWEKNNEAIKEVEAALEAKPEPVANYGYCPVCGAKGTSRERHPDGNTTCVNGHKYKSRDTLSAPPQQEAKDEPVALKMDVIVVNLVREGINKHRARELAEHFIKHTTTPPQRTWAGLTEDDKVLIKHDADFNQFISAGEYADRVQALTEARLKDKNT